ncbi:unnamed protein product, partial [Microthlaspi erraticum]
MEDLECLMARAAAPKALNELRRGLPNVWNFP